MLNVVEKEKASNMIILLQGIHIAHNSPKNMKTLINDLKKVANG